MDHKRNKKEFWSKAIWPNDNIAEITCMGNHSLRDYANGFLEIASIASDKAIKNECSIDTLMPAILYNIRHSVELFLKYVLYEISKKTGQNIVSMTGHRIKNMFNDHKECMMLFFETEGLTVPFQYKEWIIGFEGIINFVDAYDSDGQTIRFPTNSKGKPNLRGNSIVSTNDVYCFIQYIQSYFDEYDCRGS